jgi:hypothetical protein
MVRVAIKTWERNSKTDGGSRREPKITIIFVVVKGDE